MQTATATKAKAKRGTATESYPRTIDLGNGVMFPVKNEQEAGFVEWMIERARAGRVSLPKSAPGTFVIPTRPTNEPTMSSEEFWKLYNDCRADRF